MIRTARAKLLALLMLAAITRLPATETGAFGNKDSSEAGLIGILYDLKQTQKRQPTSVNPASYSQIVEEFLESDWSESVLNRYFRATRALHATQIFIPLMSAGEAPKAFDVQRVIKPSAWLVYYKGQVSPPEDGIYRFIGYADDILAVAVDGKTVCVGARFDLKAWKAGEQGPPVRAANGSLTYGDWIPMKKNQPVDLDILIGERPGGQFCAFLLYEKQGADYPRDARGQPLYPLFQLAFHRPQTEATKNFVPFSVAGETWKGYQ